MNITVSGLHASLGGTPVLRGIDLQVPAGSLLAIVGPNGSGKSTLLRTMYGAVRPDRGSVHIGGTDMWRTRARDAGRLRAVLPQHQPSGDLLRVRDVVGTARHTHRRWFDQESAADREAIARAMDHCGVEPFADRPFAALSGGERQRVLLARALAQETPVLLLDEPTNHLDPRAQLELLELVRPLELTRVVVLHDLDHALGWADKVAVLDNGLVRVVADPEQALAESIVEEVFGLRSAIVDHPLTGRLHITTATRDRAAAPGGQR